MNMGVARGGKATNYSIRPLHALSASASMPSAKPTPDDNTVLSPVNHSRDNAGLRYVYPVVSRRAGGV
ncbi:MAG TPA: hypothetical protein VF859_13105, partial [Burkholderiales bacterium]